MGLTITKAMGMGKREPNQISSAGGLVGRVLYGSTYECAAVSRVAWDPRIRNPRCFIYVLY